MLSKIKHIKIENSIYPIVDKLSIKAKGENAIEVADFSESNEGVLVDLEKKSITNSHENIWIIPKSENGSQILLNGQLLNGGGPFKLLDNNKLDFIEIKNSPTVKPFNKIEIKVERELHLAGKVAVLTLMALLILLLGWFGIKIKDYNQHLANSKSAGGNAEFISAYKSLDAAREIKRGFFLLGHILVKDKATEWTLNKSLLKTAANENYPDDDSFLAVISEPEIITLFDFFKNRSTEREGHMKSYLSVNNYQTFYSTIDKKIESLSDAISIIKRHSSYTALLEEDIMYYKNLKKIAKNKWAYTKATSFTSRLGAIVRAAKTYSELSLSFSIPEFIEYKEKVVSQFHKMANRLRPRNERETNKKNELIKIIENV